MFAYHPGYLVISQGPVKIVVAAGQVQTLQVGHCPRFAGGCLNSRRARVPGLAPIFIHFAATALNRNRPAPNVRRIKGRT